MPSRPPAGDPVAPLIAYLRERFALSDEHADLVRSMARPLALARGEHVQRAGEPAEATFFVTSGLLRAYVLEEDGREHILRFAAEGWWLGDPESATAKTPTKLSFEAIEPSRVLRISHDDHVRMMEVIPGHAAAYVRGIQRWAAARERWILGNLGDTAEERYRDFVATYPGIAARVSQRMIASYLGLAPETLSRVRRQITASARAARRKPERSPAPPRPPRGSGAD